MSSSYEKKLGLIHDSNDCMSSDGTREIIKEHKNESKNMQKRIVFKKDGRYLIYYDFDNN